MIFHYFFRRFIPNRNSENFLLFIVRINRIEISGLNWGLYNVVVTCDLCWGIFSSKLFKAWDCHQLQFPSDVTFDVLQSNSQEAQNTKTHIRTVNHGQFFVLIIETQISFGEK